MAAILLLAMLVASASGCAPAGDDAPGASPAAVSAADLDGSTTPRPPDPRCDGRRRTHATFPPELSERLDAALAEYDGPSGAPGVSAMVRVAGRGDWYGSAGIAEVGSGREMTTETYARVGSITKTLTSAAVLQLAEEGVWSLDDPVDRWVPQFEFGDELTLRHLLSHTSGLYNITDSASYYARVAESASPADVVRFALEQDPDVDPGGAYAYSNTNYFLLGMALEAAEGRPYHETIRARLLEPHALEDTYLEQFEAPPVCSVSAGHFLRQNDDRVPFDTVWSWAAGAYVADADDLCTWAEQLFEGEVLGPEMLREMSRPSAQSLDVDRPYGLGVQWLRRADDWVIGHTGLTIGFTTELAYEPNLEACIVVFTNDVRGRPARLARPLWREVLEWH